MLSSKLLLRLQLFRADCLLFCVCTVQNIKDTARKKTEASVTITIGTIMIILIVHPQMQCVLITVVFRVNEV